jgi:hypothetical protein
VKSPVSNPPFITWAVPANMEVANIRNATARNTRTNLLLKRKPSLGIRQAAPNYVAIVPPIEQNASVCKQMTYGKLYRSGVQKLAMYRKLDSL